MTARRLAAGVAAALAAALLAGRAHAQALPLSLKWTAPPPCPSAEEVRREIARQAHVVPGRAPAELVAEARVDPVGDRWRVELRTTRAGVAGYQTLEDDSCELLARATALVLALALYEAGDAAPSAAPPAPAPPEDATHGEPAPRRRSPPPAPPEAETPPAEPAPEPAPPPPAPAVVVAPEPSPPATLAVAPAPRVRAWTLAAEARVLRGPLPETTFGFGLGVDRDRGRWLLRLRLLGVPGAEQPSTGALDVSAHYQAWGGSLAPCIVAAPGTRLALAGCVEVEASVLAATSSGAASAEHAFAPWYAVRPAALARVRLSARMRLELGAGLGVSIDRPRFALRHFGDVYEVPRFVYGATVGLSVDL